MNVLVVALCAALVASWIYFMIPRKNQTVTLSKNSIEQRDDDLVTEALGRMTEEEFKTFTDGDTSVLTDAITAIKRERIPDYDFKVQQYQNCLDGAQKTREDHLRNLASGYTTLASHSLEDSKNLQAQANKLRAEIDSF